MNQNIPPTKVTVKLKTEEVTVKEDFLLYGSYTTTYDDVTLNELIDCTLRKYAGELIDPDITITSKITWVRDGQEKR